MVTHLTTFKARLHKNPLQWLFACPFADEAQIHRWRLVNRLLLVLVVAQLFRLIFTLLDGSAVASVPFTAVVVILYLINHQGRVRLASHTLVWSSLLMVTAAAIQYSTAAANAIWIPVLYGISMPALFVVPILLASTLLGARSLASVTAVSIVLTLSLYLWVLPQTVAFRTIPEAIPLGLLTNTLTLLGAAGGLGWQANRVIDKALVALRERNVRLTLEVAERMRAEGALRASEERYRSLFEHNLAGAMRAVLDGAMLDCNAALVRMLGYNAPAELVGRLTRDIFSNPDELESLRTMLHLNGSAEGLEVHLQKQDDTIINALINISQIEDGNGQLVLEGTVTDITALKQKEVALQVMATHDPLTGLYNRRALNDIMARLLTLHIEGGDHHAMRVGAMALILIDIDRFKTVNDRYGHQAGDTVLQEVAQRITRATRAGNYVARYGGEEIAVLLPGAGLSEALVIAERIRASVAASPVALMPESWPISPGTASKRGGVQVTVSLGIACLPADISVSDEERKHDGRAEDALISVADRGLYQAKRRGRNRVVAANGISRRALESV